MLSTSQRNINVHVYVHVLPITLCIGRPSARCRLRGLDLLPQLICELIIDVIVVPVVLPELPLLDVLRVQVQIAPFEFLRRKSGGENIRDGMAPLFLLLRRA